MSDVLATLQMIGLFVLTVVSAVLIHGLIVLPLFYVAMTRMNPYKYMVGMSDALVTAFGISSRYARSDLGRGGGGLVGWPNLKKNRCQNQFLNENVRSRTSQNHNFKMHVSGTPVVSPASSYCNWSRNNFAVTLFYDKLTDQQSVFNSPTPTCLETNFVLLVKM